MKDAPSYPLVPAEWFQENPRQVASAYVQLDQLTRAYRQAREALPEFSEEAVLRLDNDALKALRTPLGNGETCLLPHDHTTVLTLRSHLQSVAAPSGPSPPCEGDEPSVGWCTEVLGLKPVPSRLGDRKGSGTPGAGRQGRPDPPVLARPTEATGDPESHRPMSGRGHPEWGEPSEAA